MRALKLSFHLTRSSPTFFKPRKVEGVFIAVAPVSYSEADMVSGQTFIVGRAIVEELVHFHLLFSLPASL